jgi:hypothetical protein
MNKQNYAQSTKLRVFGILGILVLLSSGCNLIPVSAEEYFDKAALNANTIANFGSDYFAKREYFLKNTSGDGGVMKSAVTYLEYSISQAEKHLTDIKGLPPTTETKPMIDASIDLYQFMIESYKTDYMPIAKMIDSQAPKAEIDKALSDLDAKSYNSFAEKQNKLWQIAQKYAKDNGIKLTTLPNFNKK